MAWLQLGVHVVFMIGDQVDRLWGRDFYQQNATNDRRKTPGPHLRSNGGYTSQPQPPPKSTHAKSAYRINWPNLNVTGPFPQDK